MDILDETISMLASSKGAISRRKIAQDTGLGYEWLQKLAQGHIEDPGIKRIYKLNEYLRSSIGEAA